MNSALLGVIALVPAMLGPLPQAGGDTSLTLRLCNGGAITIPVPQKDREEPAPCHAKVRHAECSRKRFDPSQ